MQEVVEANDKELYDLKENNYCVKSVRIRMSVFYSIRTEYGYTQDRRVVSPNVEKYGPEKLRIRTLFTQWICLK